MKESPCSRSTKVLKTVPRIGEVLSTVIMLETGPIDRFHSLGNYASYVRCVASTRVSNNKNKGEGDRKCGNAYLSWAFVEAAHRQSAGLPLRYRTGNLFSELKIEKYRCYLAT